MEEQDYIVKNGMIQVQLDRVSKTPIISEVPERYKDLIILDMWNKTEIKVFDTVDKKPRMFTAQEFKGWLFDKNTNKLRLVKGSNDIISFEEKQKVKKDDTNEQSKQM